MDARDLGTSNKTKRLNFFTAQGNALQSQDNREGLRALPLKPMECDILRVADKGVRELGAIMHAGAMILLFLLASSVAAQELPSQTDLRAASCKAAARGRPSSCVQQGCLRVLTSYTLLRSVVAHNHSQII